MKTFSRREQRSGPGTFEATHPWLNFNFSLAKANPQLWISLGEARSKCEHLAGVPLKPAVASYLHQVYLARGAHATAAIEGNTLSEEQVLERMAGKAVVPDSQKYLQQEIDNVLAVASDVMLSAADRGRTDITPDEIRGYNRVLMQDLDCEEHVVPGEYRTVSVGVMDYRAPDAGDCDHLVKTFCDWLNSADFACDSKDDVIVTGIVKAIVSHLYFAWIHPFGDGNGRTARMLEVRFLAEAGVPSPAVQLLSNHYNKTRSEYYRQLSAASKREPGDICDFITYAVNGFVDQLRDQLRFVRKQQWDIAWVNYIYESFGSEKTLAEKRQIHLLLGLSAQEDPVPFSKLRYMTPPLAELYAGKTPKTITRDMNGLAKRGLVAKTPTGYVALRETILAFLPARADVRGEHAAEMDHVRDDIAIPAVVGSPDLLH